MEITTELLIRCGVAKKVAANFVDPLSLFLPKYEITTPKRFVHFIAQTVHESIGYTRLEENLNYSAVQLIKTWEKRFTLNPELVKNPMPRLATLYARQPEKIANFVYGGREGNGPESSGDGWRYRGRGIIQATLKNRYIFATKHLGKDYVNNPDWLARIPDAVEFACLFWKANNLLALSDLYFANNDPSERSVVFAQMTKNINGGYIGLSERKDLLNQAIKVFAL